MNYVGFIICAAVIFFAGTKLSHYGNLLAEKTGWGRAWIGLILMASVTSLPELTVGISSAAWIQSADLAVGNIFGACAFNLAVLSLLDALVPRNENLFGIASPRHVLSAALSIVLVALAALGLFLPAEFVLLPSIGLISIFCLIIYLFSVRVIYQLEISGMVEVARQEEPHVGELGLRSIVLKFLLYACITVGAALFIPSFAEKIAEDSGLSTTVVGTLFLAASTTLPEIAVSVAAVRMAAIDLAVGNLLGSNIFNILVLSINDFAYRRGVLLKDASEENTISALAVIIMTAIAIAGFTIKAKRKRFPLALDAFLILVVYALSLLLILYLDNNT